MTVRIDLQAVANQSLSIALDELQYDLTIKETNGVMSVDFVRENITLMQGARVVAGTPLLPYRYQQNGNFIFITSNGELPYFTKFGISQSLIYASPEELASFIAAPIPPTIPTVERIEGLVFHAPLTDNLEFSGAGSITFARNSIATGVRNGVLSQVAVNTPRFEDEGVLIEGEATNRIRNSGNADSWNSVLGATNTPDSEIFFNTTVTEISLTDTPFSRVERSVPVTDDAVRTFSAWVIGNTGESFRISIQDDAVGGNVREFQSHTFSGEWEPVNIVYIPTIPANNSFPAFVENGLNVTFKVAILSLTGISFSSSYIPTTTTAPVTRPPDALTVPFPISGTQDFTIFIVSRLNGFENPFPRYFTSVSGNELTIRTTNTGQVSIFAGGLNLSARAGEFNPFDVHVLCVTRNSIYVNGSDITDSGNLTTLNINFNSLNVGSGEFPAFGNFRNYTVYNRALSASEILTISRQMLAGEFRG